MQSKTAKLLADAFLVCERAMEIIDGVDIQTYSQDWRLQDLLERQFITLGEAFSKIGKIEPAIFERIPGAPDIVAFRNLLVHGYDSVIPSRVFLTAQNQTARLKSTIEELLHEADRAGL